MCWKVGLAPASLQQSVSPCWPLFSLRPCVTTAKYAIRGGLMAYDYGRQKAAELGDMAGDLAAEARAEAATADDSWFFWRAPQLEVELNWAAPGPVASR